MDELQDKEVNELVSIEENENINNLVQKIEYVALDDEHYAFKFSPYDNVYVNMEESEYGGTEDVFSDAEFEESVDEDTKSYYILAAISGLLTGALDSSNLLNKIEEINGGVGIKKWKEYIVDAAKIIGYKKNDYNGAVKYILNRGISHFDEDLTVDDLFGKCIRCLSMHPSYVGLCFSIFSQFSGERYSLTKDGLLIKTKLPNYYAIGKNREEKIVYGLLYFVFYLVSDELASNRRIIDNIFLPKEFIKLLKELINIPIIQNIPENFEEAEKQLSVIIDKIFQNNQYLDLENNTVEFDLSREVLCAVKQLEKGVVAVVLNDCITRGIYVVKKLVFEFNSKSITSKEDIKKIDLTSVIPHNNRIISRMSVIASGTFVAVNVAKAVVMAIEGKKSNKHDYLRAALAEINVIGVGKFIFHVTADSQYIKNDIKVFFEKFKKHRTSSENKNPDIDFEQDILKLFELTPAQTWLLYSLENAYVEFDIAGTKKDEDRKYKQMWLSEWKQAILRGFCIDNDEFFVKDEDYLYQGIFELAKDKSNWNWFYLLTIEMTLFIPYREIGSRYDKEYKKLKLETDYIRNVFIRRQTVVSQDEVDSIVKNYSKYKSIINGNAKTVAMGIGISAFAALATGGAAFMFAPQIAIAIAGEAVAGLQGAALINASLAFIGGGSLASGGLGMAGGTAIITGGGAILGMAGSGTTSIVSFMKQVSSEYMVRQSAKLLTFCSCVIEREIADNKSLTELSEYMQKAATDIKESIEVLEREENDLEKENIEKLKEYHKYLTKCFSELKKLDDKVKHINI